jgi:hypothetical protein
MPFSSDPFSWLFSVILSFVGLCFLVSLVWSGAQFVLLNLIPRYIGWLWKRGEYPKALRIAEWA